MTQQEIQQEQALPFGAKLNMNAKGFYQPQISIHGDDLDDLIADTVEAAIKLEDACIKAKLPIQRVEVKKK